MPVYMILFKASEINIKPPHNSVCVCVCVCGGGGVREVMILNSILGLGKMMWKHERAYKGPHRKSSSEPRLKLWLPDPHLISWLPGAKLANVPFLHLHTLSTSCFICTLPKRGSLFFSRENDALWQKWGNQMLLYRKCDHWHKKAGGNFTEHC